MYRPSLIILTELSSQSSSLLANCMKQDVQQIGMLVAVRHDCTTPFSTSER